MSQPKHNSARDQPLAETMSSMARELSDAARACAALQWSISTLLEKVHHPDLAQEMHMLQDIDRMNQTLHDLSELSGIISRLTPHLAVPLDDLVAAFRLESLKRRMFPDLPDLPNRDGDGEDITWF